MEPPSEPPTTQTLITPTLLKSLASTQSSTRSKSLKSLFKSLLSSPTPIPSEDLKKLWKSLFYCMWHSDKSQAQSHLINLLSSPLPTSPPSFSLPYFSHFIITMRREWPGIDRLRLDKFYLLVRHFLRGFFSLMEKNKWAVVILEEFVGILEKDLFLEFHESFDNGVGYHVVSIFCEELGPFLPLSERVLGILMRPFVGVLGRSENKVLVGKVKVCVFDYLVKCGKGLLEVRKEGEEEVGEKDERVLFGMVALGMGFSTRFYEVGSSEECVQGNRKVLLGLSEEFGRLEKERDGLGVVVELPEVVERGEGDVPLLVPINGEAIESEIGGDGEGKKKKKKKKKNKKSKESEECEVEESEVEVEEVKKSKKKKKKKKNGGEGIESEANGDTEMVTVSESANGEGGDGDDDVDEMEVNEAIMSNLQKQFEKIAAESGLDGDGASAIESEPVSANGKVPKKRKRSKSVVGADGGSKDEDEDKTAPATEGKSVKRVRFAMKNNLVWKPQSPLPPQCVRIPPSSTPRGSALKKGVSPGPIRDISQEVKKAKKKKPSPLKKARKVKSISPAGKRGKKKVKPMSA